METKIIQEDTIVFFIEASSFPEGIGIAFQKLFSTFPSTEKRNVFGISRPENGKIVYKAAAELISSDDRSNLNLPSLVIEKGEYYFTLVKNFRNDINSISKAFMKITSLPNIDPNGYYIEWYQDENDVLCLVKIKK